MHGKILTTEMLSDGDLLRFWIAFVPVHDTIQMKIQQSEDPIAGFSVSEELGEVNVVEKMNTWSLEVLVYRYVSMKACLL
ncbi:hypothetical protein PO902_12810 [Planococcus maritimus]|nr:hypothetical protein [Planococcus sp. SK3692]MDE4085917.1 hypothetical protein [Planococcus maritimus]